MRRHISPACRRTIPIQSSNGECEHLPSSIDKPSTQRSSEVKNATKLSHYPQTSVYTPTRTIAKNNNNNNNYSNDKIKVERSSKSDAIAHELQMLSDEFYGHVESKAPQVSGRSLQERTTTTTTTTTKTSALPTITTLPSLRSTGNRNDTKTCVNSKLSTDITAVLGNDDAETELTKSNTYYTLSALPTSWLHDGPGNPEGELFDASDSNLLCMDVYMPGSAQFANAEYNNITNTKTSVSTMAVKNRTIGNCRNGLEPLCVIGSADHGLRVFNMATMREVKNLYNKSFGHTEWVTTCKFLPSGQVLSGGMDSKLCLWDSVTRSGGGGGAGPARCRDLLAHTGSISQVEVNDRGSVALSASYDRTLRLWDLSRACEIGCLAGHSASVMQFSWSGNRVLSGDRQGSIKLWDINTAQCTSTMKTSKGQVGALAHLVHDELGHLIMYGDQGGVLTVVDTRCVRKPVVQEKLHTPGVLSGIRVINETPYIVTCGADRRICVLDPRQNYTVVHTFTDHVDYIYSLETLGPLILSGAGNGWVLVHDAVQDNKCCYGLQPHTSAVREMFASPNLLVTAGDDGKACVFHFD